MNLKSFFVQLLILVSIPVVLALGVAFAASKFMAGPSWLPFVAGLVVGVASAAAIAKLHSTSLNKTVRKLVSAVRAVEQGEKREPLALPKHSIFYGLAESMNALIDRDKAVRDANEDPLTGLANRRYLTQRLERLLEQKVPLAVMFIDLDGFKPINDKYGHDVGDEALRMVSDRLGACIRESDVLSRIGGDEFIILFTGLEDEEVLKERGDKVLEMVRTPMWISGNRVRMGASIGISVSPKDGEDVETIINAADESMYAAKQGGKNAYRFYS